MARLKDRNTFPPGGFQFYQPQTNWSAPNPDSSSFDVTVRNIVEHRKGNRWISEQNNLSTDPDVVADELDAFNAERMLKSGWNHFLSDAGPSPSWLPRRLSRSAGVVVESVKKTAAGVKVIAEWLGSGLRPVDKALAEKRGSRCIECPNNVDPNWLQKLDAMAAADVKKLVEIKNDLKLETKYDNQLNTCGICDCFLKLKIWVPTKHIANETSTDTLNRLSVVKTASGQGCWVPEEVAAIK